MTSLNEFDIKKYNGLPPPKTANDELELRKLEFKELLAKVEQLTGKEGIELGLRLLHSHEIPLEDGQAMVETFAEYEGEPAFITSADLPNNSYPASWILNNGKLLVFEYSTDPYVKRIYEKLLKDSSVLNEINTLIKTYNLESLIGPCITARDMLSKFDTNQHKALVERTVKDGDRYKNIVQSRPNESSSIGIKTLWGAKLNNSCITNLPCFCCAEKKPH
ncbi:11701_t:CDS:1 [Dentiscutata erythropus]|uniref:11701_t:CDS:1 n=1 Tax=Dentiscutata erythropus TaxID=1348616 RepID=A0A9N9H2D4_9GLOM|nr:11701_t:CDS:1 [Dentiscutata erythropus]